MACHSGCPHEAQNAKSIGQKHSYLEFLEALVDGEIGARENKGLMKRVKAARFPVPETLADIDFDFQPKLDIKLIKTLASCDFTARKEYVIFVGQLRHRLDRRDQKRADFRYTADGERERSFLFIYNCILKPRVNKLTERRALETLGQRREISGELRESHRLRFKGFGLPILESKAFYLSLQLVAASAISVKFVTGICLSQDIFRDCVNKTMSFFLETDLLFG